MSTAKPKPVSVAQLTARIKNRLNSDFPSVWVRGEISGLMVAGSGHVYFNLKDETAQVAAMIWQGNAWRIQFELKNGMEVVCQGGVDVYPPRGTYQLSVRQIHEVGVGAKQLALRKLHEKLKSKGWFDPASKKALPRWPRRIAVVTSPVGAAVRDFLEVIQRRWPNLKILIIPTPVQGDYAGPEIAAAVRRANRIQPALDAIVVTRGGGSPEDLWCFNDESLCQAIFESDVPVISGVGHEIDVSLCDLVADVRALTPSEAAERLVPNQQQLLDQLGARGERMKQALVYRLEQSKMRLDSLASRSVLVRPLDRIRELSMRLDLLGEQIRGHASKRLQLHQQALGQAAAKLESLSPLGTLARGYSLTTVNGKSVRSSAEVVEGDIIESRVEQGKIISRVESCE
jgi:exodeoxyribonuclease VII large subunit